MALFCYSLSEYGGKTSKRFTITQEQGVPSYAELNTAFLDVNKNNPFWGGDDINFYVYTDKKINKNKLYSLFSQMKKTALLDKKQYVRNSLKLQKSYFLG